MATDIIKLLPENLANQIAAGEVVQRPSSIVKELLENSIDAQATSIHIIIKEGGKTSIQVSDNGIGMSQTDARMCFERHATSKINSLKDLFQIKSLGFRGEAIASIAGVAKVKLITAQQTDTIGTEVEVEAGIFINQKPITTDIGTTIIVKNLFFNVPARRNFLKSKQAEIRYILDEIYRVALSHPEIGFYFSDEKQNIMELKPSSLAKRIVLIFGSQKKNGIIFCKENIGDNSVEGYIGKADIARKTRGEQFFFVNGRYIKHPYFHHAVMNAYKNILSQELHPFYILFLKVPLETVDINVHPSKNEAKFEDPKLIYTLVQTALKKVLMQFANIVSFDFNDDVNHLLKLSKKNEYKHNSSDTVKMRNGFENNQKRKQVKESTINQYSQNQESTENNFHGETDDKQNKEKDEIEDSSAIEKIIIQKKYMLCPIKSGAMLIDIQAAYEKIFYDRFKKIVQNKNNTISQNLLFHKILEYNINDYQLLLENKSIIETIGIYFEDFGKNSIVVQAITEGIEEEHLEKIFEYLIEELKNNNSRPVLENNKNSLLRLAKKLSSEKIKKKSNFYNELDVLIEHLFMESNEPHSPSGKKITIILDEKKIEKLLL